ERGAGAAPAAASSGAPQPALVAAEAGPRSAAGGLEVRQLSPAARDLSRMPARRVRSAGAAGGPAARAGQAAAGGAGGLAHSLAVRGVLALQLRGELHLRRRYAAGGAPRAGAVGGSGPAPRAARRVGDARAARCALDRGAREARPAAGSSGARHRWAPRSAAPARRPERAGDPGAVRGRSAAARIVGAAAGLCGGGWRREALGGGRGRGAAARRPGRRSAGRLAARVARAGEGSSRRSRFALGANARTLPRRGSGGEVGGGRGGGAGSAGAAGRSRAGGRVPARRPRPRMGGRGGAQGAQAPRVGPAAQAGGAGGPPRAGPLSRRLARDREAAPGARRAALSGGATRGSAAGGFRAGARGPGGAPAPLEARRPRRPLFPRRADLARRRADRQPRRPRRALP